MPTETIVPGVIQKAAGLENRGVSTLPVKEASNLNPSYTVIVLLPGPSLAHEMFWLKGKNTLYTQ